MAGGLVGGRGNRGGRARRGSYRPNSEINVTPMVDVMLVLLIVFMVAAPMLTVGVKIDLPRNAAGPLEAQDEPPLTVTIKKDNTIYLMDNKEPIPLDALADKIKAIREQKPSEKPIFIRGDKGIDYGQFMVVMGKLSQAGLTKVALVADPDVMNPK